ncbi:hypothetical protein [Chryseobacterium gwangjuense]|uniref:hypothetical protein n=1 Tax=Chryseobacterium gwangjuense TaxID=1069980 RepID=UPI001E5FE064|nr:hypothetical protein [Chryseobacterium gwangjuense]MCE3075144.1 hypothetical protein [Chryseobacterium gwangjuense]
MEKFNGNLSDLSHFNILTLKEVEQGFLGNKNFFEEIITNKTFQEISNEIALNSPFGKSSQFYRQEREIITGQIPKL